MRDLRVFAILAAATAVALAGVGADSTTYDWEAEFRKNTADRVRDHGYPAEWHQVETEDNYVISVFRIPYSHKLNNEHAQKPAILLQHGLTSCSDVWILNGPDDALAFLLADAGYDVWMSNARGTRYSRNNTRLSPNHPYFWRFSWHEIGAFDMAAAIDHITATTGESAIHYVGHSQGTTVFLVLTSFRPEYNAKIKTAHLLAPVGFMSNMTTPLAKYTRRFVSNPNRFTRLIDTIEVLPDSLFFSGLQEAFCTQSDVMEFICSKLVFLLSTDTESETNNSNMNMTISAHLNETHPAGCSTTQLLHYMQEYESGRFCQYDHGEKANLQLYGQSTPPDYDVSQITAQVHMYYSDLDDLADVKDVEYLASILPREPHMYHVPDPTFNHGDFVFAMQVKEVINDRIISACDAYEDASGQDAVPSY